MPMIDVPPCWIIKFPSATARAYLLKQLSSRAIRRMVQRLAHAQQRREKRNASTSRGTHQTKTGAE